ncbi:ROK family protein [Klebsiella pneumoniae subsp. pneumoniae]|nr:ROK family protein [Klebsiella pneumoniae subsp. pneumoniae]
MATIIRSLALAEHYFGASRDCEDSILGACTAVPGRGLSPTGAFLSACNGNVGEIGHIQVDPLGERAATAATSAV